MGFLEQLTEALEVADLAKLDTRLETNSDLTPISSKTERVPGLDRQVEKPLDVNVNLTRDKPRLSDDIIREDKLDDILDDEEPRKPRKTRDIDDVEDFENDKYRNKEDEVDFDDEDEGLDLEGDDEEEGLDLNGDDEDEGLDLDGDDEEIRDDDFEDLGEGDEDQEAPINASLIPSAGVGYTVNQAKSQLDGIIKQWTHLSGNYAVGSEEKEKFQEIGERLEEISRVLYRDFIAPKLGVAT